MTKFEVVRKERTCTHADAFDVLSTLVLAFNHAPMRKCSLQVSRHCFFTEVGECSHKYHIILYVFLDIDRIYFGKMRR